MFNIGDWVVQKAGSSPWAHKGPMEVSAVNVYNNSVRLRGGGSTDWAVEHLERFDDKRSRVRELEKEIENLQKEIDAEGLERDVLLITQCLKSHSNAGFDSGPLYGVLGIYRLVRTK